MTKRQEIRSEESLRGLSRYTCDVHVELRFLSFCFAVVEAEPGSLRKHVSAKAFPQETS